MGIHFDGNGSGDHIDLGTLDVPSGVDELSIFAWVNFDSFTVGDQRVIAKATSHDVADHWFMLSSNGSNQMRVRIKTNGTTLTHYEDSATINTGQWYHMGFVYDGSNVTLYRDGSQNGSSGQSGNVDTNASVEVRIADNPGLNRKEFDGIIEDVRIYNRALSAAEVQTIYAARGRDDIIYGLLHRWLLNEGYPGQLASGSGFIKDLAGRVNGTPSGSPPFTASELTFGG
jgi:hypothetical protein